MGDIFAAARRRRAIVLVVAVAAALVTAALIPGTAQAQSDYEDIDGHWAERFILSLQYTGVLEVPEDEEFHPDDDVTRLDFTVWLAKTAELAPAAAGDTDSDFSDLEDVPDEQRGLILAAVEAGLVQGYPDGTFRPDRRITRAELATLFGRSLVGLGVTAQERYFDLFEDREQIPDWATPAATAVQKQIVIGMPGDVRVRFAPGENATRAEAATMLVRYRETHNEIEPLPQPEYSRLRGDNLVAMYYGNGSDAYESLLSYGDSIDLLIYTGYWMGSDGKLYGGDSQRTFEWAAQTQTPLMAMVAQHDRSDISQILNDPETRRQALESIVSMVESGYAGVNIDFEMIDPDDRDAFTTFVGSIASRLRPQDKIVSVAVMARNEAMVQQRWAQNYDYAGLGRVSDYLMVMTYDQHYNGGPPGPIGGRDWAESVMSYAASQVDSSKLLLGIPAYARSWILPSGPGTAITGRRAIEIIQGERAQATYDPVTAESSFTYTNDEGERRIAYYTPSRGLQDKLTLTDEYDLGGMMMWQMGQEIPPFWDVIRNFRAQR